MTPARSPEPALVYMGVTFLMGGMGLLAGLPDATAFTLIVLVWACGALWRIGMVDARRYRIDSWWLLPLIGAGALWQPLVLGPDAGTGLTWALLGAGTGLLVGAVPLALAEALGRRWPFYPGDVLLFSVMGWLLGPWGLLGALSFGAILALVRHGWVQGRRGRSWLQGHAPLGPGMAVSASFVLAATGLVDIGLR
ncbi:MAG: hypothetical protein OXE76_04675 [Alphaproteobacteria bacterium]|nr:hypothetical protein [Alphaproteobacteria bacterium]